MSLFLVLFLGFFPSLVIYLATRKKPDFKALGLTAFSLFGWGMFMDSVYQDKNIWHWIPESSAFYILTKPIEDMLFVLLLVVTPVFFYIWVKDFFKKKTVITKKHGVVLLLLSIVLLLAFDLVKLPLYTRYLPFFSIFPSALLLILAEKTKINFPGLIITTFVVLIFSFIWNNLAVIFNIWIWEDFAIFGYFLGMPIDEIFFALLIVPAVIVDYQSFISLTNKNKTC